MTRLAGGCVANTDITMTTRKVSRSLHFSSYPPFSHTYKSYAQGSVTFLEAVEQDLARKKAIQEMQPFFR